MVFCWSCGVRFTPRYEGNRACADCTVLIECNDDRFERDLQALLSQDVPDG